ncbi:MULTISPECIES: signal peptidase [Sphingobacterium]|uniref:Signal peptidase n=1 Tax=Sphingobacterium hotanense TaxID=649196 RepID=A0ABT7NP29_9SPHI|nr:MULTISPECIES: signal peptidase [Sphingobacterium]MCT1523713.1 signal peptidase [Sphingobacterium hotanense]MDM1049007.1 signal peptidase [Sphingobacterium hotanense]
MNKYLLRGIVFLTAGIICVFLGYTLMENENNWYKLLMTLGVIFFGIGFVALMYRIFRKIDRKTLIDDRKEQQEK